MLDTSQCTESLEAIRAFADSVGLREQLEDKLAYLGGRDSDSVESKCVLGNDFAPHSLRFCMYTRPRLSDPSVTWKFRYNGGLIYQGPDSPANGCGPSLCVSLAKGDGWFVHT